MKPLVPALLAALAGPALADAGSSASLTGLRYAPVDLAPGDGIAPSIRFGGLSISESFVLVDWCSRFEPGVCQRSEGSFTEPSFSSAHLDQRGNAASSFAAVSAAGLFAGGQWAHGSELGISPGRSALPNPRPMR